MEFAPRAFDFGSCSSLRSVGTTMRRTPRSAWSDSVQPDAKASLIQFDAFGLSRVGCSTLPFSCLGSERTSPHALAL